ncbi:hypothetical protein SEPCBS119000_003351 [Sporothrix epigloea]|uniref:EKC/KEOPS complex subunit BUD32 n=1 Tax=Sporothrix epigloea TaxID=1892477 RepID=A0ABP0DQD7_9PEZI
MAHTRRHLERRNGIVRLAVMPPQSPVTFPSKRDISVTYHGQVLIPDDDNEKIAATELVCLTKLQKHIDDLGTDVLAISPITVSLPGSHDADEIMDTICHLLSGLRLPFPVETVGFDSLTKIKKICPEVDSVTYAGIPTAGGLTADTMTVFKCCFTHNEVSRAWNELQLWARLPRDHPHIVPFDAVVLEKDSTVIGFTSIYIPGGALKDTKATVRPFRMAWFKQLLSVVDDLNYRYGIMHQDIAARNLVIDADDNLRIFDFDFSGRVNENYDPNRVDTKGVIFTLYEVMTLDEHYRSVPHAEQDAEALLLQQWESTQM